MTLVLRSAARSDIGLVREHNEDAAYAGRYLVAVADGMGGQAAGEVASAVTIASLARLDADHAPPDLRPEQEIRATPVLADPGPAGELVSAIGTAYRTLGELVESDVHLEGMGTTATALLRRGDRLGLLHVGDSRAYLLRNGRLGRITRDHTFVQSLVDSGRLTEEQARVHPQRALLLRAIDGRHAPEPDVAVDALRAGDRYLLCSDGLCGVVAEPALAAALTEPDREAAADHLVELARLGGGPDNITVVVVDVVDVGDEPDAAADGPAQYVGAAADLPAARSAGAPASADTVAIALAVRDQGMTAPQVVLGTPDAPDTDLPAADRPAAAAPAGAGEPAASGAAGGTPGVAALAGRPSGRTSAASSATTAHALASATATLARGGPDQVDLRPVRRRRRRGAILLTLAVLGAVVLAMLAGWGWTRTQYYVGVDAQEVVIFRGVNADIGGIRLYTVVERTGLPVSDLAAYEQAQVDATVGVGSLEAARAIVAELRQSANVDRAGPGLPPSGTPSPPPGGSAPTTPRTPTTAATAPATPRGSA